MTRYSIFLVSILVGGLIQGCSGSCCGDVNQTKQNKDIGQFGKGVQKPPVAKFTIPEAVNGNCTPGSLLTFIDQSTDSDGTITESIFEQDKNKITGTTITCPDKGKTSQICLTTIDNDNLSSKTCQTISGDTQTRPPVSILKVKPNGNTGDGQFIDCSQVHDRDTVHTYPDETYLYGSNEPKDIKTVTWEYTYLKADGSIEGGPTTQTQAQYNAENNNPQGVCEKWFHTNGVAKIDIKFTTLDDDHESNTTAYTYDVNSQTLTQQ